MDLGGLLPRSALSFRSHWLRPGRAGRGRQVRPSKTTSWALRHSVLGQIVDDGAHNRPFLGGRARSASLVTVRREPEISVEVGQVGVAPG